MTGSACHQPAITIGAPAWNQRWERPASAPAGRSVRTSDAEERSAGDGRPVVTSGLAVGCTRVRFDGCRSVLRGVGGDATSP